MRLLFASTATALMTVAVPAADLALAEKAAKALERSVGYLTSISTHGGYLWRYSLDLKQRAGEIGATDTQIWVQPPGTPTVGMAFLRAYEATRDTRHLEAARGVAHALAQGQLESGGWDYVVDFDPQKSRLSYLRTDIGKIPAPEISRRKNLTNFDDDTTQSGLRFLLAFADAARDSRDPRDAEIRAALDHGLKKMIESQYPIGAWPQRWKGEPHDRAAFPVQPARYPKDYPREHPKQNYYAHYTLNDNAQHDCVALMLDAFRRTGRRELLESARRGGDFLILAQMPEPQPVWAQQYNAQMEPAWARAFEPPAVTAGESVGAIETLLDLFVETGDARYLKPVPAAIAWFKRSALKTDLWARYYELHTNKPIYGDRNGKIYHRLEDISEERQHGYSWQSSYGVPRMIAAYEKIRSEGRDAALQERQRKQAPPTDRQKASRARSLESRVREIVAALDDHGRWVTRGDIKKRDWQFADRVETDVFVRNIETLADYLAATR